MILDAAVILFKCGKTHKTYGVTVEKQADGDWKRAWAFPINEETAHEEGYDRTQANGTLSELPGYPGCPYCGTHQFVRCHCGKFGCYHGEKQYTCLWCGKTAGVSPSERFDFSGGAK